MLTGKQRSYLKGLANTMDTIVHIGKGGISQNVLNQIDDALEAREMVKVKLLDTSLLDPKETANEMCKTLHAEYVQSIGSRFILYRKSKKNQQIQLPKETNYE